MPIAGVVITTRTSDLAAACRQLATMEGVEIHGTDGDGHIVAVLDCESGEELERLSRAINTCPLILHTGLTYLNMEDLLSGENEEATAPTDRGGGQGA